MARVSSTAAAVEAIRRSHEVRIASYTLFRGNVVRALEDAARRGASVHVRLDDTPYGDSAKGVGRQNGRVARELRRCGADVALAPNLHAKAIEADGTLFLDGRNWGAHDFVVRADAADRVAFSKHAALAGEAALLDASSGDAIVETETFGSGNAAYAALERLAKTGRAPRLLVNARRLSGNARERSLLERLAREGVRVRVSTDAQKCAIAGDRVWAGSANASWDGHGMIDWGLCSGDAGIVASARARLEADWAGGRELSTRPPSGTPSCD